MNCVLLFYLFIINVVDINSMQGGAGTVGTNLSEYGGATTTLGGSAGGGGGSTVITDSMGFMSSSSRSWIRFPAFQIQVFVMFIFFSYF